MKRMKKLVSLLLAMVMVMAMTVTGLAMEETTYTITIKNSTEGHTYEAYQIFKGDLSEKVLSNINWADGLTDEAKAAARTAVGASEDATAAEVAALITEQNKVAFAKAIEAKLSTVAGSSNSVVNSVYSITGLSAGYYLVKDQDGSLAGDPDAYTNFVLKVVSDTEVNPKSAIPTVDKQVKDEAGDAETGATDGWGETADHAINESFQFKLIAKLENDTDYDSYTTYKVTFTDTMSTGITFESIESVTVDGITVDSNSYECTATENQAGGSWTLTIEDIKKISGVSLTDGVEVVVIYNAHLNENAKVGNVTDNNNKVYLEYSNNPNGTGTGKTEEDTVWVFTYKMDNTKYENAAEEGKELAGAEFRLYSDVDCAKEVEMIYDTTLGAYRPIKSGETATVMTSSDVDNTKGQFNIVGLDAGTYYLKETKTPEGYNTCANVTVVISATHNETEAGTSATTDIKMKMNDEDSEKNSIINKSGATLPETGGMGTTIIYVVGTILVLGAAILLITKKRMNAEKE